MMESGFKKVAAVLVLLVLCLKGMGEDRAALSEQAYQAMVAQDYKLAVSIHDKILKSEPTNVWSLGARGQAYRMLGELDKALADANEVIRLDTNAVDCYELRAFVYMQRNELEKEQEEWKRLLKFEPKNDRDYFTRGYANSRLNKWDGAIEDFSRYLQVERNDIQSLLGRGEAYKAKGDFAQALKDFDRVLKLESTNMVGLFDRGMTYLMMYEPGKATPDVLAYVRLRPEDGSAHVMQALLHQQKEEYREAIQEWNAVLRLAPKYQFAYMRRGLMYVQTKEWEKAEADLNAAVQLDPNPTNYFVRSIGNWQMGKLESALTDLKTAMKLEPTNVLSLNNLAWFRATCEEAKFRDGKQAVELATKACESSEWKVAACVATLAAAYAESGDFEKAVKYQKQAMDMKDAPKKLKPDLERRLKLYEDKKPTHEVPKMWE